MVKKWFKPTEKCSLLEFGYSPKKSADMRRRALKDAIDSHGATKVFHKVQGLANVTQSSQPQNSEIYKNDAEWISDNFLGE